MKVHFYAQYVCLLLHQTSPIQHKNVKISLEQIKNTVQILAQKKTLFLFETILWVLNRIGSVFSRQNIQLEMRNE